VLVVRVMAELCGHPVVARTWRELTLGGIVNEGFPLGYPHFAILTVLVDAVFVGTINARTRRRD
jgi:hypothetical protein